MKTIVVFGGCDKEEMVKDMLNDPEYLAMLSQMTGVEIPVEKIIQDGIEVKH